MHVEDAIDMDKLKAHVNEIEGCRPLKDNWVREVLSNNLRQVIKDIEEIKHIKSLPQNMEYSSPDENYQNLVIMSLTHEDRLLSVMDRKKNLMQRIRDKVVFRMRSAEEQFKQFLKELDHAYRVLEEEPLGALVHKYHPIDVSVHHETTKPPLTVKEKEDAIEVMAQEREEQKVEEEVHPNQEEEELKPPKKEEIDETLAVN